MKDCFLKFIVGWYSEVDDRRTKAQAGEYATDSQSFPSSEFDFGALDTTSARVNVDFGL